MRESTISTFELEDTAKNEFRNKKYCKSYCVLSDSGNLVIANVSFLKANKLAYMLNKKEYGDKKYKVEPYFYTTDENDCILMHNTRVIWYKSDIWE